jgi:lipid II:glycine glycyltransferase (peptidoglycan interpeptide bridge formation enzyme)
MEHVTAGNQPASTLETRAPLAIRTITDATAWDDLISGHPYAHPLQCWGWGELKRPLGWQATHLAVFDGDRFRAGALLLTRRLGPLPVSLMYVPRGPVVAPDDVKALRALAQGLLRHARAQRSISCKVDPAWQEDTPHALREVGFRVSPDAIQATDSYTINLTQPEETLLANMRSKTRQYIRKAEREETVILRDTTGEHLDMCYALYQETARRAGFALRPRAYYDDLFRLFPARRQYLYVALRHGTPLAFLWLVCAGRLAVELFGGMADSAQEWKSNYLLKWHAIRQMKSDGYQLYDLHGRATEGIAQFKEGFGPQEASWISPHDAVYRPLLYTAWQRSQPLALWLVRRTGRSRTPQTD